MNWKIISAIFIALTIIFAGVFIGVYYQDSSTIAKEKKQLEVNDANELATEHWNQIAIENLSLIMKQYDSNATLHWIGGPLNGTYHGTSAINTTWDKFFTLWQAVWFYASTNTTNNPIVTVSGNTATVTADFTQFVVQSSSTGAFQYINTTYSIEYYNTGHSANGPVNYMIINETFHITGAGKLSSL
jgi:hypothetical protein